jgi:ABC-2 type transport system permease protein
MKNNGLWVLYKKELADHLKSKRFFIVLLLIAVTGLSSIYGAASGISSAVAQEGNEFVFLRLFTSSGNSVPSFVSFMSFLGPLVGIALGFDAINGERNRRTLSRLLAQPIHRDSVINGKFLAGVTIIVLMVLTLGLGVGGLGIIMIGVPPTLGELLRIILFMIITILYISLWLVISQMCSLFFKQTATSALACIAIWLFLSIFIGLLAGVFANTLFPVNDQATVDVAIKNAETSIYVNRISPAYLYDEVTTTLLNPDVRTLGPVLQNQMVGAIAGVLPLSQSVLLIWPHIITIIAACMICFAISYIFFMKQEIRA